MKRKKIKIITIVLIRFMNGAPEIYLPIPRIPFNKKNPQVTALIKETVCRVSSIWLLNLNLTQNFFLRLTEAKKVNIGQVI